ncbi:Asp23/Gls24 family envelope stress response protein [Streptomyces sp. BG9H]|uniref:Asp23/Gls24 family envelope stress response protein n=1 Tax=Streptomyces anatolicus TaxID=2675858 RepID=A0ABS6YPW0_9ACTN|nr:Asp23/Gls24 family envelope stress response protein [Streptomyces anatolicus]
MPCGRELWSVWERWESGEADPHAAACPHCTEALNTLRHLEDVVSAARATEPREQETDASALVGRVMDVVRLELRPGRTLPLGEEEEDAWIVEAAAARTVRAAAETLPGVRAGSCRIEVRSQNTDTGTETDTGTAAPAGRLRRGPVGIRLEVEAPLTWHLQELAEQVRHRVLEAVDAELGMRVTAVDVTITDITDATEMTDTTGDDVEGRRP